MENPVIETRLVPNNKMALAFWGLINERLPKEKLMETIRGRFTASLLGASVAGLNALSALAWPLGDTDKAGVMGLPQHGCLGMYCPEVRVLAWGQAMRIIHDDYLNSWTKTEVVGTGEGTWGWDANTY